MRKFEYKVIDGLRENGELILLNDNPDKLAEFLNIQGEEGWELVSMNPALSGSGKPLVFKRQVWAAMNFTLPTLADVGPGFSVLIYNAADTNLVITG